MTEDSPESDHPARTRPGTSRPRLLLFRLALVSAALVLALVLGEVGARISGRRPMQSDAGYRSRYKELHQLAPQGRPILYELKPLARTAFSYHGPEVEYRINADGLRADRRYARPKPAGVKRVLMLGDSVLLGIGVPVEDLFASRMEAALDGVEVVNGGVGGYNTYIERMWLEAVGLSYQPDLLVLCYCPNDVDDPLDHFSRHTVEKLPPFAEESIPNPAYHARGLARPKHASKGASAKQRLKKLGVWATKRSALANLCAQPFSHGRSSRNYERCLLAVADTASAEHAWLERQMQAIAATVARAEIPVLFVYLPLAYELDADKPAHEQSRRNVNQLARAAGFHVVDVFDALANTREPYIDVSHLSVAGHRTVAAALTDAIRDRAITSPVR